MSIVYLGLGTNLGDRLDNLLRARLALHPEVRVLTASPIYETPPWGYLEQPDFLNQVLKAETALPPFALLDYIKEIEVKIGRTPGVRYGPRLIDLDILLYDDISLHTPQLTIPHPRLAERAFALAPLADLAPNLLHPIFNKTIHSLLAEVDSSDIRLFKQQSL
jgi:2-amino-4-hydroxy-6-hydroxymethyldihydropteridine diphosphokinase